MNEFVQRYIKLAYFMAAKFRRLYMPNLRDELISEALWGLTKACLADKEFENSDHEKNYVAKTIEGTLLMFMRNLRPRNSLIPDTVLHEDKHDFEYEEVIKTLAPDERRILKYKMEGYTVREIAEIEGTYHVKIVRILKKIAEELQWLKDIS